MDRHRNIKRIDDDTTRTHSWVVIVQRRGESHLRWFTDGIYGGKEKALAAAIEHRDFLVSSHSESEQNLWVRTRLRKNNTSGIPGVGRYEALANPNTGRYNIFWLASWIDEYGRSRKRKFYVSRYGERLAKQLAIAERERQLLRVCVLKDTPS